METSLKECIDHFLEFEQHALHAIHYDDGTIVAELYWPEFFKLLRILKNHITANLASPVPIGKLAEIPLRKTLALLNQLEIEYPSDIWDQGEIAGLDMSGPLDQVHDWSRLPRDFKRDIRSLYLESYKAMANTIELDPFDEFFYGIDRDRKEINWRGKTYKVSSTKLILVLLELAKLKGVPITRDRLRQLRPEFQDLDVKALRKLTKTDDKALVKLIQSGQDGFTLRIPKVRAARRK